MLSNNRHSVYMSQFGCILQISDSITSLNHFYSDNELYVKVRIMWMWISPRRDIIRHDENLNMITARPSGACLWRRVCQTAWYSNHFVNRPKREGFRRTLKQRDIMTILYRPDADDFDEMNSLKGVDISAYS